MIAQIRIDNGGINRLMIEKPKRILRTCGKSHYLTFRLVNHEVDISRDVTAVGLARNRVSEIDAVWLPGFDRAPAFRLHTIARHAHAFAEVTHERRFGRGACFREDVEARERAVA